MSTIASAPPAATLALLDSTPQLFKQRDEAGIPCALSVPGSRSFALKLFSVTVTGTVKPASPGMLTLTLYGMAKASVDAGAADPANWLPLGSSTAEPIGGASELPETMWMIQGADLMIYPGSGKMQGTFKSNVADHPIAPIDLEHHPDDIEDSDPLYVFAVGASFEGVIDAQRSKGREAREGEEPPPICELEIASFTMDD